MLSWSDRPKRRAEDAGADHPDSTFILFGCEPDASDPSGVILSGRVVIPASYAPPDRLEPDVIEPTAVFKPWIPSKEGDDCIDEDLYPG
jgi:hypothetical protein